ncbi:MAG TPA: peptide-N-glycosidase F-related protein [Bacteroidia bacterium]|jgi:hypothetical protein|nr:peptide-N-glycosidase F-related protein [Bacteroidia bacterium]
MKQTLFLCLLLFGLKAHAAPGDTTWIQANSVQLNYYNNFDTLVSFPNGSKSYRKILMQFTLGEYACPPASTYCHQWDYTVTNYVMTKTDTVELSRFITPYATAGGPRFPTSWKQHYIFDVTDYYTLLKDSAKIRINYSGYSGGFTADVKFAFIEGTPERNVLGISKIWSGSFNYGNSADPIANHIPVQNLTAPANTQFSELKFKVTGHGSDATTQCCEFASHNYYVNLNGGTVDQRAIWRNDCGLNELYPQGGTWIYNRGNWCPGAAVKTNSHRLAGVTGGSSYTLGVTYDAYTTTGSYGLYDMEGDMIYYDHFNHAIDASLNAVIAPSNFEDHFRENPTGNQPLILVHNAGSTTITAIKFSYGVLDSVPNQYTWTGSLPSQADTLVTLPSLATLTNMSHTASSGLFNFVARIVTVNGGADEDTTNNVIRSRFTVAPSWPATFSITLKTNSEGVNGIGISPSETSWQITDMNNTVIASRTNANVSTTYIDTVNLPNSGFFKLTINDLGCDGLHWWVWDQNPSYGVTAGSLTVKKMGTGAAIPMNGYYYSGTFNNDFGCGFTQYFSCNGFNTGINEHSALETPALRAFPNPAQDQISIQIDGKQSIHGVLELVDAQGKVVYSRKTTESQNNISLEGIAAGIYTVTYSDSEVSRVQTRIAVMR